MVGNECPDYFFFEFSIVWALWQRFSEAYMGFASASVELLIKLLFVFIYRVICEKNGYGYSRCHVVLSSSKCKPIIMSKMRTQSATSTLSLVITYV